MNGPSRWHSICEIEWKHDWRRWYGKRKQEWPSDFRMASLKRIECVVGLRHELRTALLPLGSVADSRLIQSGPICCHHHISSTKVTSTIQKLVFGSSSINFANFPKTGNSNCGKCPSKRTESISWRQSNEMAKKNIFLHELAMKTYNRIVNIQSQQRKRQLKRSVNRHQ